MPLTPADVHNVVFKKPPIGKRGYDEDDVDAFLDEVERELARLIEETSDAGSRGDQGATGGFNDPDVRRLAAENAELKEQLDRLRQEKRQADQSLQQIQQQMDAGGGNRGGALTGESTGEQQAVRVLMMAQRTADDHLADAHREAEKLITDARAKADELTRNARNAAEQLERDARQRHQEAMGGLDAKRGALQKHIEDLKAFEREYRTRLKAYLEGQLRDLDGRSQALDSDGGSRPSSNGTGSYAPAYANGSSFGLSESGRPAA
ncbi:MAG TPA: DivIVA domain-containing protein [Mycobacteriales bacterium]|nr:DivIVA domain-containing protein [Mycobacteriales bacterium]